MTEKRKECGYCKSYNRQRPMCGICLDKGTEKIRIYRMRYDAACNHYDEEQHEVIKHIQL